MRGMERYPRRATVASRAKACLLAAGLALLAPAHANPFASPEPAPPPQADIPLPPEIIDQLPPLPAPSIDEPIFQPEPTPEERLAELLPTLTRPTFTVTPHAPSVPLPSITPAYRAALPTPTYLDEHTTHSTALITDPGLMLRQALEQYDVQLLAVLLSGAPRAIFEIDATPYVIPHGDTLPGGAVRLAAITPEGVVLTYDGHSLELPLGGRP